MSDGNKLTIWGRKNSINVMKVLWSCEELGLVFDRIDVGGEFAFTHAPDYLKLNPNGRVPTLKDGNTLLWESNVVVRYLSETHGRDVLWPKSPALRWEAEKWMDWQQTTLGPSMGVLLLQLVRTPPEQRDPDAIERALKTATAAWMLLNDQMAGKDYITGSEFNMGDIPLGCMVYRWYAFDIERPSLPHVEAWYDRLKKRAGFAAHVLQPLT